MIRTTHGRDGRVIRGTPAQEGRQLVGDGAADRPACQARGRKIRKREQGIAALESELARSPHRLEYSREDAETLKAAIMERMARFRELMQARKNIPLARQVLRKLLGGEPIRCIPITRNGRKDSCLPRLAYQWRPHGDSNPGYRRERAMS
jgi:hypothetical protein